METQSSKDQFTSRANEELEFDEFVPGAREPVNRDRHAQYTHELSVEATEAALRVLVRTVPLVFGGLLGGLVGNIAIGLAGGMAASLAFDLSMENKSMLRSLYRRIWKR